MKNIQDLIEKFDTQAMEYRAEFNKLDERMPSLDFEESKRHAETEVLFNKCLEFIFDLKTIQEVQS